MLCTGVTKKHTAPAGNLPLRQLRRELSSAAYLHPFLFCQIWHDTEGYWCFKRDLSPCQTFERQQTQRRRFKVYAEDPAKPWFSLIWAAHATSPQLSSTRLCSAFPKCEVPASGAEWVSGGRKHQYPPVARRPAGRSWPEFLAQADVARGAQPGLSWQGREKFLLASQRQRDGNELLLGQKKAPVVKTGSARAKTGGEFSVPCAKEALSS